MRYREKDYEIFGNEAGYARIVITVYDTTLSLSDDVAFGSFKYFIASSEQIIKDSIRLVVDETAKIPICSSMQKDNIVQIAGIQNQDGTYEVSIKFALQTGKSVSGSDDCTIELDFGEIPADLATKENIDYIYDTFDADMALQLDSIIGTSGTPSGNSQTEGQINELKTLQESYDSLADNVVDVASDISDIQTDTATLVGAIETIMSGFTITPVVNPPDQQHNYYQLEIDDTVKIEDGTLIIE